MEIIGEMVRTVLMTGFLAEHDPVSMILIAPPESGKTSIVLAQECKSVVAISDITGRGLQKMCIGHPELRHIVINDLIAVQSHKPAVMHYTIAMLNAMVEEGIQTIVTPESVEIFTHGEGRRGIITSITSDCLRDGRTWFNRIGFCSRMLPFAYRLPDAFVCSIKADIDNDCARGIDPHKVRGPRKRSKVSFPDSQARDCRHLADQISIRLGETGIRRLKQMRALARGHALLHKRKCVRNEDIEFLESISKHISFMKLPELEI